MVAGHGTNVRTTGRTGAAVFGLRVEELAVGDAEDVGRGAVAAGFGLDEVGEDGGEFLAVRLDRARARPGLSRNWTTASIFWGRQGSDGADQLRVAGAVAGVGEVRGGQPVDPAAGGGAVPVQSPAGRYCAVRTRTVRGFERYDVRTRA
jgi:hypothetical protein